MVTEQQTEARTPAAVLREARALIEDPARWTQGWYARRKSGHSCKPKSPAAVRWCAYGACERVAPRTILAFDAQTYLEKASDGQGFRFNDAPTTTHADVLALFDRALELADGGGR